MSKARLRTKEAKPRATEASSRLMATRRVSSDWSIWRPRCWQGLLFLLVLAAGWLGFFPSLQARRGYPGEEGPTVAAREKVEEGEETAEYYTKTVQDAPRSSLPSAKPANPNLYTFRVVKAYPHDPLAFTQGLLYYGDGTFYESTGLRRRSSVREVDLASGKVRKIQANAGHVFGEGLALWKDRLLQIAWQTQQGFLYDRKTLRQVATFQHPMADGWGLTNNGSMLFGTDGSSNLFLLHPTTFRELGRKVVRDGSRPVANLNELEYIDGEVWANIWMTDCIVRIAPETGRVTGWLHMPALRQRALKAANGKQMDVLNGIAWDRQRKRLFVTGKLWSQLYHIKTERIANPTAQQLQFVRDSCIP